MFYLLITGFIIFIIILLSETSLNHNDLDYCMLISVLKSNNWYQSKVLNLNIQIIDL